VEQEDVHGCGEDAHIRATFELRQKTAFASGVVGLEAGAANTLQTDSHAVKTFAKQAPIDH
jgi:hypothetical protein